MGLFSMFLDFDRLRIMNKSVEPKDAETLIPDDMAHVLREPDRYIVRSDDDLNALDVDNFDIADWEIDGGWDSSEPYEPQRNVDDIQEQGVRWHFGIHMATSRSTSASIRGLRA